MFKWLKKKLCPSGRTLAGYAADGIQRTVNGTTSETKARVARLATYATDATRIANRLSVMVADGTIDQLERDQLQELLTPIFEGALDYAFTW